MKTIGKVKILSNREIVPQIYEMILLSKELTIEGFPGKFVNLYCEDGRHLLPRPISICEINREEATTRLIYAVVGEGTKKLSKMQANDEVKVLGPLGNGFTIDGKTRENIVIGGGIGAPPLVELVKHLKGNTSVYLGFRCNPILVEDFENLGAKVYVATEDGSHGHKGNVLQLLEKDDLKADMIYSCGPKPMLKAVAQWAKEKQIPAELSLEERMACGIGACLVCTCKAAKKEANDWENTRVCKDGPVFLRDEVIWE
ncbi:dihydroorotate dehydrogenase electron transfer subunit [Clostridium aceticum]|uniref:Dihydroorotate dehydrogenase B (NAD(+)), electron transfer subunit n=1 Tax=Clostridium aceticum TaxID=84022 RepID=A0A0D8IB96_9CLOT|nr:dihydroorotate dehydrogenase electron transfer subunit [Clostridium aceticum]AKL96792.1 dihydroorotate dehydrogenase electron transfer subunit [Clostridium aceticum]KJF27548.1 dihydroorotate dehydrogenase [Clostridium aceticum]